MGCYCSSSYCYGRCRDYTSGYKDGYAQARAEEDILKGEDPTMYLFVGGPYHNQHKKTGGRMTVTAPVIPPTTVTYCGHAFNCGPISCGHSCCRVHDFAIRTGIYEKTQTSKGWFVYRWKP